MQMFMEQLVKDALCRDHPAIMKGTEYFEYHKIARTNMAHCVLHHKLPDGSWSDDRKNLVTYKTKLFADIELNKSIVFYNTETISSNAVQTGVRFVVAMFANIDVGRSAKVFNTGTYKVLQFQGTSAYYIHTGMEIDITIPQNPVVKSEEYKRYARVDVSEKTSDW
jgi:hypothetical protein